MGSVTWASIATTSPMGQQRYEHEIQAALRRVAGPEWTFESVRVASARSTIEGARRLPTRLSTNAPLGLARLLGRSVYGRPDLVHRLDLRLPAAWGREIVTVHDLPPLRFPDEGQLTRSSAGGARRAARVIVPSAFAEREVRELLGVGAVDVVPYGASAEYLDGPPATDGELQALGIRPPFLLHAAGASARKNLVGLAEAWARIAPRHPEVSIALCGPSDARRDALFSASPRAVMPGRLEPHVIATLMRRAVAVVVPSTYEGFGLPALEGMACGAPVVAARRGALPEVIGDAGLLVEPDGASLAAGLETVLANEQLADDLRARGRRRASAFDWTLAAREHIRIYAEVLGVSDPPRPVGLP